MSESQILWLLLDISAVLVGEFSADDLDEIDQTADAKKAEGQCVENARADLAHIVAVHTDTAAEHTEQQCCHPVLFAAG